MSPPALELSFAADIRLARRIGLGMLVFGLFALGSTLFGDLPDGPDRKNALIAGWIGAVFFGGLGALVLWSLRSAGASALRIDATGITSTTGRGTVLVTWSELAAVDVWVSVRTGMRNDIIDPKKLRTRIRIFVRLAPVHPGFGSRHDLKPLRRILGSGMFTHGIGVPPPAFSTGESLPEVDQIEAALAAFAGERFQGVSR
jgi:hypothetical protein